MSSVEVTNDPTQAVQELSNKTNSMTDDRGIQLEAWPVSACGCSSSEIHHIMSFEAFQANVNAALEKLPPQYQKYDRVLVLLVYWEESDVPSLNEAALELKALFEYDYGFEVDTHVLKNGNGETNREIHREFSKKLNQTIEAIDSEEKNNLFILYYAGHGAMLKRKGKPDERVWQPEESSSSHLPWKEFQRDLRKICSDILFLFDCCYASGMIDDDEEWERRCEILCASGAREKASATRKRSFTRAIVQELSKRKNVEGRHVLWFHTLLTSTEICDLYGLSQTPVWRRYSSSKHQSSIFIESRNRRDAQSFTEFDSAVSLEDSLRELDTLTGTRILIKLHLSNPAELLLEEEWMKWFRGRPSNVGGIELTVLNKLRCHGLFKSDSSLLLLSMPIWIWVNMQPGPACEVVGILRSSDLMLPPVPLGNLSPRAKPSSSKAIQSIKAEDPNEESSEKGETRKKQVKGRNVDAHATHTGSRVKELFAKRGTETAQVGTAQLKDGLAEKEESMKNGLPPSNRIKKERALKDRDSIAGREKAVLQREQAVAERELMLNERESSQADRLSRTWLSYQVLKGKEKVKHPSGSRKPAGLRHQKPLKLSEGSFTMLISKRTQPANILHFGRGLW